MARRTLTSPQRLREAMGAVEVTAHDRALAARLRECASHENPDCAWYGHGDGAWYEQCRDCDSNGYGIGCTGLMLMGIADELDGGRG